MTVRSFLDSNILIYTDDRRLPEKRERATFLVEELQSRRSAVVSTQVLQEYFSVATRKLDVPAEIARAKVELFSRLSVVVLQMPLILRAIDLHRLHSISFWDGLIIAAAQEARCRVLLSEDLQHGRRFDGLEVVNPFL